MTITDLLDRHVRSIADWPEPGVTFSDITPLMADPSAMAQVVAAFEETVADLGPVDAVVGIESRGFWFAIPLAMALGVGFVPIRKAGKLPAETVSVSYDLEYGSATMEMHADAVSSGQRVLVVDDVLATGGTLAAARDLLNQVGAHIAGHVVLIELMALQGRNALGTEIPIRSLRAV